MARIVFDLDGTLIDSAPDIHGIANALLAAEGLAPITLEQTREFIGNGASVFVQRMRAARGIPDSAHDRMLADFIAAYEDAVHLTVPYPGVPEALEALRAQGHALGSAPTSRSAPRGPSWPIWGWTGSSRPSGVATACRCTSPTPRRCAPRLTPFRRGPRSMSATARWTPKPRAARRYASCCSPKAIASPRSRRSPMPRPLTPSTGCPIWSQHAAVKSEPLRRQET
ncbi:haloacid dehalogenase-like hydrolase [Albidovulum inexpectatum]|uniref:phosphoglycolate phosphatase n=1 Tax=Albidovulum inexpectatum TaxID=196587 RepID=A0A2S5JFR3_9RHOB|nr:haloacid dehalogenase-like hydrolase [Albidovulum inexpectatum]